MAFALGRTKRGGDNAALGVVDDDVNVHLEFLTISSRNAVLRSRLVVMTSSSSRRIRTASNRRLSGREGQHWSSECRRRARFHAQASGRIQR